MVSCPFVGWPHVVANRFVFSAAPPPPRPFGWLRSLLEENCRTVVEELNGLPRWTALGNGGGTDLGSNGTSHGVIVLLLPRSLRFGLWTGSVGQQSSCLRRRWRWLNWVINIE